MRPHVDTEPDLRASLNKLVALSREQNIRSIRGSITKPAVRSGGSGLAAAFVLFSGEAA